MAPSICMTITSPVMAAACHPSAPPVTWHMVPLSPIATQWVLVLLSALLATLLADRPKK
ncbi:hypothetical protein [Acidocella facilis]|uniref:hypothetical protein n=1 Tax=Acidocella facilis TaxID=525 RepID=UPI001F2F16C7|nr:hypothetical protein [Acidocella facilis]